MQPDFGFSSVLKSGNIAGELAGAQWIWGGEDPRPMNVFRLFRREFTLNTAPDEAHIWSFAEFRYKLFINGRFVQTGPTPCQPEHRLIDRHDIRDYLSIGDNCIAYIVHCPGIATGQWTLVSPALLSALVSDGGDLLQTDASWRTVPASAWRHPTQICNYAKGFHEWNVLCDIPPGWDETGFDDSAWEAAYAIKHYAHGDPDYLAENYVGYPTLVEHLPDRLACVGLVDGKVTDAMVKEAADWYTGVRNRWLRMMGKWNLPSNDTPLDTGEPMPEPIAMRAAREGVLSVPDGMLISADRANALPVTISVPDVGHPFAVFDLGIVRSGLLMLEIESNNGGTVDIGWDDRIDGDGRVKVFRATPNSDRIEVPPGRILWESFFERGARYVQITMRDFRGNVVIHSAGVRETLTSVEVAKPAVFESSDDLLNRIWRAAVETTRLYMNGCGSGDPMRERCHWLHDDAMAMRMAFYCFGEWRGWRRGLELTAQSQNADGSLPVISPGHFEDFNMITGSCYWAVQVREYMQHTGDRDFAEQMLPCLDKLINYELRFADSRGLLFETPGRRFLSWADRRPRPPYEPGEMWETTSFTPWADFFDPPTRGFNAIINTYWLWCIRETAALAESLGRVDLAERYRSIFQSASEAFHHLFWDSGAGLYRDNVVYDRDGRANNPTYCESTLFQLMRAGLIEQKVGLACIERLMNPSFVCCRTPGGLDGSALPVFLIEAGRVDEALDLYRDRWGRPISAGATTCGEVFLQGDGMSDAHIHGATPARDFLEHLAGIRIMAPWWTKVLLAPPVDSPSLPELRASVPTPHGSIEVVIEKRSHGRSTYMYSLPPKCEGFLQKPDGIVPLNESRGELLLS